MDIFGKTYSTFNDISRSSKLKVIGLFHWRMAKETYEPLHISFELRKELEKMSLQVA